MFIWYFYFTTIIIYIWKCSLYFLYGTWSAKHIVFMPTENFSVDIVIIINT